MGKRRSRGRLTLGKHHLHPRRQESDVNTTESDSEEGKVGPQGAVYVIGAPAHAGISQGNLGKDEPASVRRSRWPERRAVWKRARNASRGDLQTVKGRQLPRSPGSKGRDTQRAGQSRDKTVGDSNCRGPAAAAGSSAHSGGGV